MVDDGLQRDGHVADVVGLHSGGQVTESARAPRRMGGGLREFAGRLISSSSSLTAPARPLPPRTSGHYRTVDGAGAATVRRAALPTSKLASCLNFAALQIQLLARINSSRRGNKWKMSPDVPP